MGISWNLWRKWEIPFGFENPSCIFKITTGFSIIPPGFSNPSLRFHRPLNFKIQGDLCWKYPHGFCRIPAWAFENPTWIFKNLQNPGGFQSLGVDFAKFYIFAEKLSNTKFSDCNYIDDSFLINYKFIHFEIHPQHIHNKS